MKKGGVSVYLWCVKPLDKHVPLFSNIIGSVHTGASSLVRYSYSDRKQAPPLQRSSKQSTRGQITLGPKRSYPVVLGSARNKEDIEAEGMQSSNAHHRLSRPS